MTVLDFLAMVTLYAAAVIAAGYLGIGLGLAWVVRRELIEHADDRAQLWRAVAVLVVAWPLGPVRPREH